MRNSIFRISLLIAVACLWSFNVNAAKTERDDLAYYKDIAEQYEKGVRDTSFCEQLKEGGVKCFLENRYTDALRFYIFALDLANTSDNTDIYEFCSVNIGIIYAIFKDYERAAFYFEKTYKSTLTSGNRYNRSIAILSLVAAYCKLGKVSEASACFELQSKYPINDKRLSRFYWFYNKGLLAYATSKEEQCIGYMRDAIEVVKADDLPPIFIADTYMEITRSYYSMARYDSAIVSGRRSLAVSAANDYMDNLCESYDLLSRTYERIGLQDSCDYYKAKYLQLTDSVFDRQRFNEVKNELFEYENRMNDKHISSLNYTVCLLVGVIALLLVGLVFVLLRHVRNGKSSRQGKRKREVDAGRYNQLIRNIERVLEDGNVIQNPNFCLSELSERVGSNTKYVSEAINATYNKSFKTVLNEYRIREACRRLDDKDNYGNFTIVAIGSSVGYNSSTGFIQAFKKVMGMSPAEYRKERLFKSLPDR